MIMRRRSRTSQIINLIDFHLERIDHIVPDQLEIRILEEVSNILLPTGEKIVQTQDLVPFVKESITQMRAEKARAASD